MSQPAGYSGTPLHAKLGVKPGHRVLVDKPPSDFDLGVLDPHGYALVHRRAVGGAAAPPYDVVLLFCRDREAMERRLPVAMARTATPGRCWVARPKKSSGQMSDLTEHRVRGAALAVGWVDVKVCAVDAVWSGMCLVRRKENRT